MCHSKYLQLGQLAVLFRGSPMSEEKEHAENYAERNHWSFHKMLFKHFAQFSSQNFNQYLRYSRQPGKLRIQWRLTKLRLALRNSQCDEKDAE